MRFKLIAMGVHAGLTAIVGVVFAQYVLFVEPVSAFNIQTTILVILAVVIGGVGTVLGPVIGVAIMIPLNELTRAYFGGNTLGIDLVLFGGLAVLLGVLQPRGLTRLAEALGPSR